MMNTPPEPFSAQQGVMEHHHVPFYRDIKVLQVVAQIIFAVLFIGSLALLSRNLITNLQASNLSLDFNVFERRFGTELSEGIRFDEEWTWVGNLSLTDSLLWPLIVGGWAVLTLSTYNRLREQRTERTALIVVFVMISALALLPILVQRLDEALVPYLQPRTMTRAILTGFLNTLRVVAFSIVGATVLGIFLGIGLLSSNYLVRNISQVYVEIFRNTPLLVQLFFIYITLQTTLPQPRQSINSGTLKLLGLDLEIPLLNGLYTVNNRAFYIPKLTPESQKIFLGLNGQDILMISITAALIAVYFIRRWRLHVQELTGVPAYTWRFSLPVMALIILLGWAMAGGAPFGGGLYQVEYPVLARFNVEGGISLTIPFVALGLGLTLYTAAFIADIVRAGIQSVPKGQIEAARSQGFHGTQVLSLIILPQALRLIIPPLGNQYVNLGKNSSLGIAVTFLDTYHVVQVANNESSQTVPFFLALMLLYLLLSLSLSLLTNLINSTTQLRTR